VTTTPLVYVYGVVAGDRPLATDGIDGQPVRLVTECGVGAIVSDVHDETPALGREAVTAHSRVLEALVTSHTVLPMRFGVVMEDDDAVRDGLLRVHREALLAQLERLAGRVELTLRATYEEAPLLREILTEEPQIRALQAAAKRSGGGTYVDRIRLGEMIAAAVDARRRRDAEEIMARLTPLAEDFLLSEPRHERMALSASFLITRDDIPEFDAAVDDVGRRQQHRMRLRYTGPLPPHSFVTLEHQHAD
jgi:hypothetical protein